MTSKKDFKSDIVINKKVLLNGIESIIGKTTQNAQEEEYLILTDGDGILTGEIGKRSLSHKEGFPHYSVHIWVVNIKIYKNDIGIYISKKARKKSGGYYQFRTAGGHVGVTNKWEMNGGEEETRKQILEDTARREVMEELGLILDGNGEIIDKKTGKTLEKQSKFRVLIDKISYQTLKEKVRNGNQVIEKNNEHIGVFVFEFNGEIINFEKEEIEEIKLISSKELIKKLEGTGNFFGHGNPNTWKQSNKYKTAIKVIKLLQQKYGI